MSNSHIDDDPDRFIKEDKAAMAALPANQESKPGVKLEYWFNEENGYALQFSRVATDDGKVSFEIIVLNMGAKKSEAAVPEAAYADLQRVFTLGGSFIGAATNHMLTDLKTFFPVDPSFQTLFEWFQLKEDKSIGIGTPPPSGWERANRI